MGLVADSDRPAGPVQTHITLHTFLRSRCWVFRPPRPEAPDRPADRGSRPYARRDQRRPSRRGRRQGRAWELTQAAVSEERLRNGRLCLTPERPYEALQTVEIYLARFAFAKQGMSASCTCARPRSNRRAVRLDTRTAARRYWTSSQSSPTMHTLSSVRPTGGAASPRSVISLRRSSPAAGCAMADCTPTRTRPSA